MARLSPSRKRRYSAEKTISILTKEPTQYNFSKNSGTVIAIHKEQERTSNEGIYQDLLVIGLERYAWALD